MKEKLICEAVLFLFSITALSNRLCFSSKKKSTCEPEKKPTYGLAICTKTVSSAKCFQSKSRFSEQYLSAFITFCSVPFPLFSSLLQQNLSNVCCNTFISCSSRFRFFEEHKKVGWWCFILNEIIWTNILSHAMIMPFSLVTQLLEDPYISPQK